LQAQATSASGISLVWSDNNPSGQISGFAIERRQDGSMTFLQIATSATKSYSDSGLSAGTTYYYRVRTLGRTGPSAYCTVVMASTAKGAPTVDTTPPSVPSNFVASGTNCTRQ
jgi:hypothetical protein